MEPLCVATGVGKRYRNVRVLDDLSLRIDPGAMVAVTGPSGSGKSTLLNVLGLLERPDTGRVTLFGRPAPEPGSREATRLRRDHLGYLFQNFALVDNQTVDANLAIAQAYSRSAARERKADRAAALEQVGLHGLGSRPVFELSGGEQQRVAIARLIVKPCRLVLADEPTGSLDEDNRDGVLALLSELRASGKSVVIVTHDPHVAAACDDEMVLRRAAQSPSSRRVAGRPGVASAVS